MFARAVFRGSMRPFKGAKPRTIPLSRTSHLPQLPKPPSLPARRFRSSWEYPQRPPPPQRPVQKAYIRYNPDEVRNAKPLITVESIRKAVKSPRTKWVLIFSSASAVVFYVSNLETVPVSGRRRFNCYSDASVEQQGERMYQMVMQDARQSILPSWDPRTRMVERVMQRLIPVSGLEHVPWEVHVIQSPEMNAFVIPGGKVFVYSGILPVAKTDDGLAAILGHEIAHNLARHAAESMSSLVMLAPIRWTLIFLDSTGYTMGLGRVLGDFAMELGLTRPASRKQESEADYIGLMMMARSCYDPEAAVGVWQRMEEAQKEQVPEWLSTHPSNANRIERMQGWLAEADEARSESDCAAMVGYTRDFKSAVGGLGSFFR